MTTYSVQFKTPRLQPDKTVQVPEGTLLADAALQAGILLRNDCGGQGLCKKCLAVVSPNRSQPEVVACQYKIENSIEVIVPEKSFRQDTGKLVVQEKNFVSHFSGNSAVKCDVVKRTIKYGVAVDIGTTTLAAGLYQLQTENGCAKLLATVSRANPQRQYGADVISRIQRVLENPAALAELHRLITEAVSKMLLELSQKSGVPVEQFELLSAAGNTVMEYLFLGIDPSPLGYAPFEAPIRTFSVSTFPVLSSQLLSSQRGGGLSPRLLSQLQISQLQLETMPLFGGFVGGDIVADTLALGLADKQENSFLIDIGTNGELALFSNGKIVTAATAAGPCFEGGGITFGTLALPGAISGVQLKDDGSVSLDIIGGLPANGICGSGLIDIISELRRFDIIDLTGRFNTKENSPFNTLFADCRTTYKDKPAFILVKSKDGKQNRNIVLTQPDIRQFQLAAGAIRSGITLLLKRQGLQAKDIDSFYIAGGFGSYIKAESAQRAGILPKMLPLEKVKFCGNTSLAGAALVLFDPGYIAKGQRIAERAEHIGLESLPDFADTFAENLRFEI